MIYDQKVPLNLRTPAYSLMRVMMITWRRTVFDGLSPKLMASFLRVLAGIRSSLRKAAEIKAFEAEDQLFYILSKCTQAYVDLSVNEYSVHYTQHSKFVCDGEYPVLSQCVVRETEEFYSKCSSLPMDLVDFILEADYSLMQKIFLPCTCVEIKKNIARIQIEMRRSHYINIFNEFKVEDFETEPQPLLHTAFAKMLFDQQPSHHAKNHIKLFINYLITNDLVKDVHKYNALDLELEEMSEEKIQDDEEIEYRNKANKVQLDLTLDEITLFSIAKDIDLETFMTISANNGFLN